MLSRLLRFAVFLPLAALLLGACTDVPDAPRTTPTITAKPTRPAVKVEPTRTPSPTATATPRPRVTVAPSPFKTPAGTTGLIDLIPGPVEFSDACLDGSEDDSGRITSNTVDEADEPQAYKPIAFSESAQLQKALDDALGDESGDYAYVVKDLTTGVGATHNADKVFNSASVFKLWVMYEVFHQESLGLIKWNDELVVTPYYDAFALSPRRTQLCQQLTVADTMDAMLSISDNAAAVLLQDLVGSGNVNRAIDALGVHDSGLFEDGLPLTASDVSLLLEAIGRGQAISSACQRRDAVADVARGHRQRPRRRRAGRDAGGAQDRQLVRRHPRRWHRLRPQGPVSVRRAIGHGPRDVGDQGALASSVGVLQQVAAGDWQLAVGS